jgi:aryl-alcohol dehydrogenase-like predicted oxidoreductase
MSDGLRNNEIKGMPMKIQRREFIKRSAIGAGGIVLGARLVGAETAESAEADKPAGQPDVKYHDPFARVPLGKTDLQFTRVCMGTGSHGYQRSSNQTRMGGDVFKKLLRDAYDRGVRTFDLADLYGTHTYVPLAFAGLPRDSYSLISKMWWNDGGIPEAERPDADVVVARFLKELKTDYIDLLLLHCVTSPDWPGQLRKQMDILTQLKAQGKIRALGVSCHSIAALNAAAAEPWVESVHTRINPYGMSMDGAPDQVVPVLKKIHAAGKGVVGMKLVGDGRLTHDPEKRAESIKFVLGLGCVHILNVGFESADQIDDFAAHVRKVPTA